MKKSIYITILFALFAITINCTDKDDDINTNVDPDFKSTGQITGKDTAACPCCGNWKLKIDGDNTEYQFIELPAAANIDLTAESFPLSVKLNWEIDQSSPCKYVVIKEIIKN
jgi:hypothetical protein